jgi:hypothetical protein
MNFYSLWLFLITLSCSFALQAETPATDDIARLDQLITGTEQQLRKEKQLRELLLEYKKAESAAIKNPHDSDKLAKLVTLAKKAHEAITDTALDDYFTPQFLEELKKLSQISERKNVPAPK